MSGINQPIDSNHLDLLDAALRQSTQLTKLIPSESLLSKRPSKQSDVRRLAEALQNPPPATKWLEDPTLAKYLPIVLRLQDTSGDDPGRSASIQRLLMGDTSDQNRRWTPWVYPAIVLAAAMAVAMFLGITIVPTFKQMFFEFELHLPEPTKWLIWGSDAMIMRPFQSIVAIIAFFAVIGMAWLGLRGIADRLPSESLLSRLLSGSRSQVRGMARWTGSLAEMLRLGMPMHQAIALAGTLSGQRSVESQSMRLAQGDTIRTSGLSPVALAALKCEDPDKRVALLRGLSDLYWNRLARRTRANAGWIAPFAVVIVGAFVGFVVIALFMPLISLLTSLSS